MKTIEYKDFEEFLIQNNALEFFKEDFKRYQTRYTSYESFVKRCIPRNYLVNAFSFSKTPRYRFWTKLSREWNAFYFLNSGNPNKKKTLSIRE